MPTVGSTSNSYRFSRTWVRNGPGPKVPHPFSFSNAVIRSSNYAGFTVNNGGAGTATCPVPSTLRLKLYRKMKSKAYAQMQLGADIGEGRKTLQLVGTLLKAVRNPLKTVGSIMQKAARRRKKDIATLALKDVSEAFLAFQYGVRPLIGAIYDALGILENPYPRYRLRTRVGADDLEKPDYVSGYPWDPWRYVEKIRWTVELQAGCNIRMINPDTFSREMLGLYNPASIAYELMTFSFLLDWFIPIGVYIASMSDYAGCELTGTYVTEFTRKFGTRTYPAQGYYCVDESVVCQRTLGVPELPSIFSVPLKLAQSKEHVANALALIAALGIKNPKKRQDPSYRVPMYAT